MAMDVLLEELRMSALPGFECTDQEGVRRRCHTAIGSYCCDIPEAKDMTSVRHGSTSSYSCHRCIAMNQSFQTSTRSSPRSGTRTMTIQNEALRLYQDGSRVLCADVLDTHSLSLQVSWLHTFPFLGTVPSLDLHALFAFEPLHNFHLGISKMLKIAMSNRLKCKNMFTASILTLRGEQKAFSAIRSVTLNCINTMLKSMQKESPAKGLRIDFSSRGKGELWNGLFKAEGLMGMLEGKDYKNLDMVSPFLGMFVDRCCGETSRAPNTSVFVQYVDLMQSCLRIGRQPEWSRRQVEKLRKRICSFKKDTIALFADFQKSHFATLKFHLLDHICDDILRLGGLHYGHAGLFEHAHTIFKRAYRATSKRTSTAMEETMAILCEQNALKAAQGDLNSVHQTTVLPKPRTFHLL